MNLADIAAVLNVLFAGVITEQFRRDAVLPNLLLVEPDANASCLWDVKLSGRTTAGPRAEGYEVVDADDMSTDTRKQATLAWAHYEAYAKVSGTARRGGLPGPNRRRCLMAMTGGWVCRGTGARALAGHPRSWQRTPSRGCTPGERG